MLLRAVLALGGLALGTYFLYGGRVAQKEIEKGPLWPAASARARGRALQRAQQTSFATLVTSTLTLSPATGGEEIKSTADHVKRASACRDSVLVALLTLPGFTARRRGCEGNEGRSRRSSQASLNGSCRRWLSSHPLCTRAVVLLCCLRLVFAAFGGA